jgi:hypothetical protein
VWCLLNGWCFVAPKMALGEARRGSMSAWTCDRGATKPKAIFGATLRAAVLSASRFVARSLQTHQGYARRSRLAGGQNPWRRNTSHLGDTTLGRQSSRSARTATNPLDGGHRRAATVSACASRHVRCGWCRGLRAETNRRPHAALGVGVLAARELPPTHWMVDTVALRLCRPAPAGTWLDDPVLSG